MEDRNKTSWYQRLKRIYASDGFVCMDVMGRSDPVTITVGEALDRAEAISGLTTENEITHRTTTELHDNLMEAALAARRQQEALRAAGQYVDFALKQSSVRKLEIYRSQRAIRA